MPKSGNLLYASWNDGGIYWIFSRNSLFPRICLESGLILLLDTKKKKGSSIKLPGQLLIVQSSQSHLQKQRVSSISAIKLLLLSLELKPSVHAGFFHDKFPIKTIQQTQGYLLLVTKNKILLLPWSLPPRYPSHPTSLSLSKWSFPGTSARKDNSEICFHIQRGCKKRQSAVTNASKVSLCLPLCLIHNCEPLG